MAMASRSNKGSGKLRDYLRWRLAKDQLSRRRFLTGAAVLGGGLAVGGIVGCG
ncbi:hypothetical protein LCGC14_1945340, partial [marine sediment metagenome]